MSLSVQQREQYSRHLSLPQIGEAGQEKLFAARSNVRTVDRSNDRSNLGYRGGHGYSHPAPSRRSY